MQRQIHWISPLQASLYMWLVGFVFSYPVIGVMWFFGQYATPPVTMNWIILIFIPIMVGSFISIAVGLGVYFYNLFAKLGFSINVRVSPSRSESVDANDSSLSGMETEGRSLLSSHSQSMRMEYENNFSDLILFNCVHQFLSPVLQFCYVSFFVFIFWMESQENSVDSAVITAVFWYFGLWLFQFIFNVFYLFSRKNTGVLTKHIVEVRDDALLEETKYNKTLAYWHGIVKVVSRPGFVAVYLTPHMAHIIPNRAFSSSGQRSEFLAVVENKISSSIVAD